jgi:fatty-acyl-CoA synthase/long-chain acyl-CoA synthetase
MGAMDERGFITLTGRLKDLIIRGGENIAPAEIESCLVEHDAVLDAVVIGVPDAKWGETVGAVLRLRHKRNGLRAELEAHCRQRLAPFKVPAHWHVADELPVTPTGKVQKFKVVKTAVDGGLRPLD